MKGNGQVALSINGIEMKKALERLGWHVKRNGSNHWIMSHQDDPGASVPIPRHRDDLKVKTLHSILDATRLTEEDIRRVK